MNPTINYVRLGHAISHYTDRGYRYVEAPWVASQEAINMTLPAHVRGVTCDYGALVGSSEQSFLDFVIQGLLEPGSYVACTPCFRDEEPDWLHQKAFMKVELFSNVDVHEAHLRDMIQTVRGFFESYAPPSQIGLIATTEGYDLYLGDIEIGSYGIRRVGGREWIYSTGLAEPRFGIALDRSTGR